MTSLLVWFGSTRAAKIAFSIFGTITLFSLVVGALFWANDARIQRNFYTVTGQVVDNFISQDRRTSWSDVEFQLHGQTHVVRHDFFWLMGHRREFLVNPANPQQVIVATGLGTSFMIAGISAALFGAVTLFYLVNFIANRRRDRPQGRSASKAGGHFMNKEYHCTCTDFDCEFHPSKQSGSCNACIEKNLACCEIPACFFHKIGTGEDNGSEYTFRKFAKRAIFADIKKKADGLTYSSMRYVEYDDCKNAEILYNEADAILLLDGSMIYFAANDFKVVVDKISKIPGLLRIHFVPREFVPSLEKLGFAEQAELVDFFNHNLAAAQSDNLDEIFWLDPNQSAEAANLSQRCKLQSRGFEGETTQWFVEWLEENKVIIVKKDHTMAGLCCVAIYNNGENLWIKMVAVDPEDQGFGRLLIQQAIAYGVACGAVRGFLHADILNKKAINLYEKFGFSAKGNESEIQMIRKA